MQTRRVFAELVTYACTHASAALESTALYYKKCKLKLIYKSLLSKTKSN